MNLKKVFFSLFLLGLFFVGAKAQATVEAYLPDLVVSDFSWSPQYPVASNTAHVMSSDGYLNMNVTIENIGYASVTLPENMRIFMFKEGESNPVGGLSLGGEVIVLNQGQSKNFSFISAAFPNVLERSGTFDLTMVVDYGNSLVNELNENNNQLTKKITIAPSGTSCFINSFEVSPVEIDKGDPVRISWDTEGCSNVVVTAMNFISTNSSSNLGRVSDSGNKTVYPKEDTTFQLFASDDYKTINSYQITVKVNEAVTVPSITVVSPNGGETLYFGNSYTIKWNTENYDGKINVSLVSSKDNGYVNCNLGSVMAYKGVYTISLTEGMSCGSWDVIKNIYEGKYKVQLYQPGGAGSISDMSDDYFTIANEVEEDNVCCEMYGYGAYMVKTPSTYQIMARNKCSNQYLVGGGRNIVDMNYCHQDNNKVTISGVSGPQSLDVGEMGTWKVKASSSTGGDLSYSVVWGDEMILIDTVCINGICPTASKQASQQSTTFTHVYQMPGTYTPKFTVTSENTIRCITYPCPSNENSASASISVNVSGSTNVCPVGCNCYQGITTCSITQPKLEEGCLPGYKYNFLTGKICSVNEIIQNYCGVELSETLKFGSNGSQVKVLQTILNTLSYLNIDLSTSQGIFGSKTKAATIAFQKANGLKGDGIVGPRTRMMLNNIWENQCSGYTN